MNSVSKRVGSAGPKLAKPGTDRPTGRRRGPKPKPVVEFPLALFDDWKLYLFNDDRGSEELRLVEQARHFGSATHLNSHARRAASIGSRCEEGPRVRRTDSRPRRNLPLQQPPDGSRFSTDERVRRKIRGDAFPGPEGFL